MKTCWRVATTAAFAAENPMRMVLHSQYAGKEISHADSRRDRHEKRVISTHGVCQAPPASSEIASTTSWVPPGQCNGLGARRKLLPVQHEHSGGRQGHERSESDA